VSLATPSFLGVAVVNVKVPDRLKRMVDSEAALVGLRLHQYVARALFNQVKADRAARDGGTANESARVKKARAEADEALSQRDD